MNYRRKFQVAASVAVLAVVIGFVGILYSVWTRPAAGASGATNGATGAMSASDGATPATLVLVKSEGGGGSGGNDWDYKPGRNPSYMKNTSIQQIGFLTMASETTEGATGGAEPTILPLFGYSLRYKNSDRWVYFTATDKYQSIRLPVEYEKRDCMNDDVGCRELYNGDIVSVPSYNNATFTVSVYKNTF